MRLTLELVASLSLAIAMRGSLLLGTSYVGRFTSFAGFLRAEKCCLIFDSMTAGSKSPTAITAIRSGRYQVLYSSLSLAGVADMMLASVPIGRRSAYLDPLNATGSHC